MQTQAYQNVRGCPVARLLDIPPAELLAFARTCSGRTRLKLLALGACLQAR